MSSLYGDINFFYEGPPTDSQVERAAVLDRELTDVINEFNKLTADKLPALNKQLKAKKMAVLSVIPEAEWQASHQDDASSAPPGGMMRREMD